jgi:cullin-associated NEDD8-dissociated protein 1
MTYSRTLAAAKVPQRPSSLLCSAWARLAASRIFRLSVSCLKAHFSIRSYSGAEKAFKVALGHFTSSTDEVRSAAAFALGNLAVGSPKLVESIVQQIASSGADDKQRALSLQALKEFIIHAQFGDLASVAESLWTPLFSICAVDGPPPVEPAAPAGAPADEKKKRDKRVDEQWKKTEPIREHWKQTETSRNVAAECLGKITLTQPQRFLPQLQARLQDGQAGIRVAIISGKVPSQADQRRSRMTYSTSLHLSGGVKRV